MPEILTPETTADQLKQFDDRVIAHPILESVFKRLRSFILNPGTIPIAAVIGPTGAGKSTLVRKLYREILNDYADLMKSNPGLIPVVLVEATSPDNGSFDWRDFYERFLEKAGEPMIQHKTFDAYESCDSEPRKRKHNRELRRAMEQCIRYRGIKIVIVDEAQHFTKILSAQRFEVQMDTIKSMADLSGAQFVMVGTKELFTLNNQNAQVARRARYIHFPRYQWNNSAERQSFLNILGMFESRLPVEASGVLLNNSEYVYEHCLGCVGTLKDWLRLAVRQAVDGGKSSLCLTDLENTALSNESLIQMLTEILEFEDKIEADTRHRDKLRTMIKTGRLPESTGDSTGPRVAPARRVVGERALNRDQVGVAP